MANNQARRPASREPGLRRGHRGARIAVILAEVLMIALLSVGVYVVSIVGTLERTTLSENDIYVYNGSGDSGIQALGTAAEPEETPAPTPAPTKEQVTQALQDPDTVWEVETEEIETQEDFLSHQETTNGYWNILVLGVDARANQSLGSGEYRADVIMICSINVNTKVIKLASIYRDTIMYMYGQNTYHKINDCIFNALGGSPSTMLSTINQNLDLNIKDLVIVNWAAVALAVNVLGGLELEITQEEFDRGIIQGYLTEVVNETGIGTDGQFQYAGLQHCDGPKVVAYCRNRYTTGSDTGRTSRQREVIEKMLVQAKSASFPTLFHLVSICFNNMFTSLSLEDMYSLVADVQNYSIGETTGFPNTYQTQRSMGMLTSSYNISDPLIADPLVDNVIYLHNFLFGATDYSPSQDVRTISDNIAYLATH